GDAVAVNTSSRYALMALQGPVAREVLQTLTGVDLFGIKYYWFSTGEVAGVRVTISRTGYTGEDGFEVFVPPNAAERVWDAVLQAGPRAGGVPPGVGARPAGREGRGRGARGSRRARHTAPRSRDASVRQRHGRHDHCGRGRPELDRRLEEGVVHRLRRAEAPEGGGRAAQARGLRDARARDRPPWLRCLRRRPEGGRRDQRHADALSEESDWHGLPAGRPRRSGDRVR